MSWTLLPLEMWSEVIYFLKIPEFISLTHVHKFFNPRWTTFYESDFFWSKFLRNHLSRRVQIFEYQNTINLKTDNNCFTIDFGKSIKGRAYCDYIYKNVGYILYKTIKDHSKNSPSGINLMEYRK